MAIFQAYHTALLHSAFLLAAGIAQPIQFACGQKILGTDSLRKFDALYVTGLVEYLDRGQVQLLGACRFSRVSQIGGVV